MKDRINADARKLDMKLGFLGAVLIPVSVISILCMTSAIFASQFRGGVGAYLAYFNSQVFFVTAVVGGTFLFLAIRGLAQSYRSEDASRYATNGFACGILALVFVSIQVYYSLSLNVISEFVPYQPLVPALAVSASGTFLLAAHVFFMRALDFLSEKTSSSLVSETILSRLHISVFVGVIFAVLSIFFALAGFSFADIVPYVTLVPYVGLVLAFSWASVAEKFFKLKIPTDTSHKTEFSRINGGVLIAISLVISIIASTMGLFDVRLTIPGYHHGTFVRVFATHVIAIMTRSFTVPLILAGMAFVVLALKNLGERYSDSRITKNAIYGFILLTFCSTATTISTLAANTAYLTPVTPVTPPLTHFPRAGGPINDPQVNLLFSWPSLISLLLSSLFFARALVLLSNRSRKRYISAIAVLLIVGTLVTVVFSEANLDLSYTRYDRGFTSVLFNTEWYLDQILVWITLLGISLLLVAWVATSRALSSVKKELLRNDSNVNQGALLNGQQEQDRPSVREPCQ